MFLLVLNNISQTRISVVFLDKLLELLVARRQHVIIVLWITSRLRKRKKRKKGQKREEKRERTMKTNKTDCIFHCC